jgi:4-diphosphocytidyl-2-C-methyl-D-erythritol kinase
MSVSPAPVALALEAPAKVNLVLRVLGRRSDGYHDIETLFQAVALSDRVVVERGGVGVTLDVRGADLGPTEENLAYRAARSVLDATRAGTGLRVRLEKRIPAGAGMGGGSSDAAAVLRLGHALLGAQLGGEALAVLGAELGSDVPFFLGAGALAWGRGRGERLEPVRPLPEASVVVVMPPVHVATGSAYAALARVRMVGGEPPCMGAFPDAPASWEEVAAAAFNDFESVIPATHPEVGRALAALHRAGAAPGLLSGSGGACFGVFPEWSAAEGVAASLRDDLGWPVEVTHTLSAFPEPVEVRPA